MTAYADVLFVTVNPHETQSLLQIFQEATGTTATSVTIEGRVYRDLGNVNGTRVFHALSEMGSGGPGAMQQTVDKAIRAVNPGAVIGIGIAFGINKKKQAIGDILISKQLQLYDLQRAGREIILRGDKPHASTRLINFFEGVAQTSWRGSLVRPGVILTGEKLVDNLDYRDQLLRFEPEAVGGEMEGTGLYVACHDHKVDWIVIKAICDWGDGQKVKNKKARQKKATQSAAEFVLHALQQSPLTRERLRCGYESQQQNEQPEQDSANAADLRLVDISIIEEIYNHPMLEMSEIGDTEIDFDGPIRIDIDACIKYKYWFPILDVKVRNVGSRVAFVKRAEFHISRIAEFQNPYLAECHQVWVSYNYDVLLKPDMEGLVVSVNLSQAIPPGDVDRFTFTVGQTGANSDSPVWYYFHLILKYNEDEDSCVSGPILLTVPTNIRTTGRSGSPGFRNAIVAENLNLFKEFSQFEGLKSPTILQLIEMKRM